MNFKTTLILLIILVAVVAWLAVDRYASSEAPQTTASATDQSAGQPLFSIKPEDVTEVSIKPAMGKTMVMKKVADKWLLTEPVSATAESWQADSLVRDITGLKTRGKIAAGIDTGLTHPRYVVELSTKEGKTIQMDVGDKTAIGDAMYVRVGDQKDAQIVPSDVWTDLSRPVNEYRDKGLVDVSSEQVKQLAITRPGEPKIMLVKEGTDWKMTQPTAMPVDQNAATDLLFAVTGAQVAKYVPQDQARPQLTRLDEPQLTVWYSTQPPTTQPTTRPAGTSIAFGGYDSVLKENVFARVGNKGEVVTLPASTLESFKKSPLDLRDKKVLNIAPDTVRKLTLTIDRSATTQPTTKPASHDEVVLTRRKQEPAALGPARPSSRPAATQQIAQAATRPTTEPTTKPQPSTWLVGAEHPKDGDDAKVQTLLDDLHPLNAQKFITQSPTTRPAARYTLVIQTNDGAAHTLLLSDEGSDGQLTGQLGDLRFTLDRSLLDALDAKFAK